MDARVEGAIRDGAGRAVHAVTGPAPVTPAIDPPAGLADRTHTRNRTRRFASGIRRAVVMPVASIVLTTSPLARASACDDYKAVLAARIEATGVRGYSLEVVPANAPVPPGAKAIANCEAGARKFLYRRWGAAGAVAAGAANAAPAASPVPAAMAADAPARRAAPGAREVPAVTALPASVPARVRVPVPDANVAKPPLVAAVAAPRAPAAASASVVAAARPISPAVVAPPPAVGADTAATAEVTPKQRASGFAAAHWQWIGALALGALVAGLWLWRARFSAYDKDGLPRGPRL